MSDMPGTLGQPLEDPLHTTIVVGLVAGDKPTALEHLLQRRGNHVDEHHPAIGGQRVEPRAHGATPLLLGHDQRAVQPSIAEVQQAATYAGGELIESAEVRAHGGRTQMTRRQNLAPTQRPVYIPAVYRRNV